MPTLPLYTPNPTADASHRVVAPGGYESWYFDAESTSGDVRLVATWGVGDPFHRGYLPRYLRYRRRPTRWPPPLPADYASAHFAVYEGERLLGQFTTRCPPEQFAASTERPEARAGANEFVREQDGTFSLRLRGTPLEGSARATSAEPSACPSAQLTFRPVFRPAPHEVVVVPRGGSGDEHRWVVADPLCEVSGTVTLTTGGNGTASGGRDIGFHGRGYHDHVFGTGPLPIAARQWVRGRLLLQDRVVAFYLVTPLDRRLPVGVRLVEMDAAGVRELAVRSARPLGRRRYSRHAQYPEELHIESSTLPDWTLKDPRLLESASGYTRVVYSSSTAEFGGQVLCEVGSTPQAGWRVPLRAIRTARGTDARLDQR